MENDFLKFAKSPPILYGQITVNDKTKIGCFKPLWNKYSNQLDYAYFTPKGKKGTGGFTLKRAYDLFILGRITNNPEHGKLENYI